MTHYDYDKFVHPVPHGYVIPDGTQVQLVNKATTHTEIMFFTTVGDLTVPPWKEMQHYLTYDITAPKLPEEVNSVIYNANVSGTVYPVAVYQGARTWSAFSVIGNRKVIYTLEIESFDTTPPKKEAGGDNE